MIYLIQYDRQTGALVGIREFMDSERQQADEFRLAVEIDLLRAGVSREVVLLEASSEDELRKTHRRYFEQIEQLLKADKAHAS
jgi:hypothetical protein